MNAKGQRWFKSDKHCRQISRLRLAQITEHLQNAVPGAGTGSETQRIMQLQAADIRLGYQCRISRSVLSVTVSGDS